MGRNLRQIDLCSGVGAGFPLSGIITGKVKLCGLCEIDEFCKERLRDRFPGVSIYNDVREFPEVSGIDIITSSPPCQSFTVEGQRRGGADKRDCIPAVLRIVNRVKPKFFCLENWLAGLVVKTCLYRPAEHLAFAKRISYAPDIAVDVAHAHL